MKHRRLWINLGLVALIAVVIGVIVMVALRPAEVAAPQRTATVARTTVTSSVTASGSVESSGDVNLSFSNPGIVQSVRVEAGDDVVAGQVLATIDRAAARQQLAAARAGLAQALSTASTSSSSVDNARRQLALADAAASASDDSLAQAVTQAKSNLAAAEATWSDACLNPDDPACPNRAAAESIRTAQNNVTTAQLAYDKAVELAASNRVTYDLAVNQASASLAQAKSQASTTCDASGSSSTACVQANGGVLNAQQAYDSSLNQRTQSVLMDSQGLEKGSMTLSNAQVALRKTQADLQKAYADTVRGARQAYTNAQAAQAKGRIAGDQSIQSAQSALTSAEASVAVVGGGPGATTVAQAGVTSARAALRVAQQAYDDTRLVAPVAGTVGSVNLNKGESSTGSSVSASSATSSGITIIPTGIFKAVADFAESDAAQVHVGDPAAVTFQALPKESVSGTVLAIDPIASTSATDQLVTFTVTVSMESVPEGVHPGMTSTVAITTDEVTDALAAPQSAINTVGDTSTVEVLQPDNTTVTTPVTLGLKGDALTEIVSGVTEGQVLVIPTTGSGGSQFPTGGMPGSRVGGGGAVAPRSGG